MKIHNLVYKITNIVNNKIYIGCHQTDDLNDEYMGSGKILKRSIEKYGIDKFKKEILYDFQTDREMFDMEKEIVNEEFISRDDTYNITTGGNGSWSHTKGTITVEDKDGNTSRISIIDPRYISGELTYITKNKVNVKDKDGNMFRVLKKDPRFLSGELVGNTKNTVVVRDEMGNIFRVNINDNRYLSGELLNICKNRIVVKDDTGRLYQVEKNDSRYISGHLTRCGSWSGKKQKPEANIKRKQTMSEHKHSQGEKNSQFGKCWIYNLESKKSISVEKEELEKFLSEGWIKGRRIKFQIVYNISV